MVWDNSYNGIRQEIDSAYHHENHCNGFLRAFDFGGERACFGFYVSKPLVVPEYLYLDVPERNLAIQI
jgi:hypothetical protein